MTQLNLIESTHYNEHFRVKILGFEHDVNFCFLETSKSVTILAPQIAVLAFYQKPPGHKEALK